MLLIGVVLTATLVLYFLLFQLQFSLKRSKKTVAMQRSAVHEQTAAAQEDKKPLEGSLHYCTYNDYFLFASYFFSKMRI